MAQMYTMGFRHSMLRDGCQLFTECKTGAKLLLDTANKRAMVTIQDHVTVFEVQVWDDVEKLLENVRESACQLLRKN